jgi:hypothetical protein
MPTDLDTALEAAEAAHGSASETWLALSVVRDVLRLAGVDRFGRPIAADAAHA